MKKIGEFDLILKPSKIEGVGVFANKNLKKGTRIYWDKKIRKIKIDKAKKDKIVYEMCDRYCVETEKEYHCPLNFQQMSIIWFLNHSKNPNLAKGKDCWFSKKEIKKGEEMTINYDELDEKVSNSHYLNKELF